MLRGTGDATAHHKSRRPTEWSLELLQTIEWKQFEEVVAAYFREQRFRSETIAFGPDGGIDIKLFFDGIQDPVAIVQCKAWSTTLVGVKPVRELLGVMAHEKVARGYFVATGDFTHEAIRCAGTNPIMLVTGKDLLAAITQMPTDVQARLLEVCTVGDYSTPTCPSCGVKMATVQGQRGPFWGCRDYPRCRGKISQRRLRTELNISGREFECVAASLPTPGRSFPYCRSKHAETDG